MILFHVWYIRKSFQINTPKPPRKHIHQNLFIVVYTLDPGAFLKFS